MILRVCLLAISMALVSPAAPDVAAVVRALEQRYNRAATLRAAFEQRHLVAGRPNRVRHPGAAQAGAHALGV